jgi:tRNA threonylcarbamoyladenosine biosynthesis protein TsaE
MEDVGALLSVNSGAGDVILLDGDLGAGKTCFSRGFVRARCGMPDERVTSPTYLLSNSYPILVDEEDGGDEEGANKVYHMDLYRLAGPDDLDPLNLDYVFANEISLIEWPSRLGGARPSTRLDITLTNEPMATDQGDDGSDIDGDDNDNEFECRRMFLEAYGDRWAEKLKLLEEEGYFEDLIIGS